MLSASSYKHTVHCIHYAFIQRRNVKALGDDILHQATAEGWKVEAGGKVERGG